MSGNPNLQIPDAAERKKMSREELGALGMAMDGVELVEYGATIAPTLQALPPRDRIVLHLRFVEDLTQAEIAERVGVSQMHVSRLIRRALERLRTVAEHSG